MSESGKKTADSYDDINKLLEENKKINDEEKRNFEEKLKLEMNIDDEVSDYYEVIDGTVHLKEKVNELDDISRQKIKDAVEKLQEFADLEQEIAEKRKENLLDERNQMVEVQNQAIEAMKSRLEAEYNATSESLDKRKSLYEKYFAAISEEVNEEDYENDRQALLNKIAKLSTATDSTSLAALKEAQQALSSLDSEYNQSQREAREQAVYDNIDSTQEALDDAYDNAMKDVQGL